MTDMPNVKTRRSAAKRFSVTGSGKVKRNKAYMNHKLAKKSSTRKMNLRKSGIADKTDVGRVKDMMPYAF